MRAQAMRAGPARFDFTTAAWMVGIVLAIMAIFGGIWLALVPPPGDGEQTAMSAVAADAPPQGSVYADEAIRIDPAATVDPAEGGDWKWKRQPNNLYYGKTEAPDCRANAGFGVVGDFEYIEVPVGAELIMKFDSPEEAARLDPSSWDDWTNSFVANIRPATPTDDPDALTYRAYTELTPIDVIRTEGDEVYFRVHAGAGFAVIKTPFHGGQHPDGRGGDWPKHYTILFVEP